jgi:hypothetical protein
MAYDFPDRVTDQWDFASQAAIWRERALHQAHRAEFFKRLAEAERTGATITPSGKEPRL